MLAALLLLLFFSCNQNSRSKAELQSSPQAAASPVVSPASSEPGTTSNYSSGAMAADSATSTSYLTDNDQQLKSPSPGTANKQHRIPTPSPAAANPDWDRKIVKTADLSIETKSFPRFTERLHRLVRESGGYFAQEEQSQSSGEIQNAVTIKVPVDRFDELLQQLPADSDRLTDKKVSSQDVSMEVVDTKSRLETKKEVRERYLDLLKQAHKMEDILSIQQEIDGIQEQMDAAAGRIQFLGHAAAFSTVNLKFFQVLDATVVEAPQAPTLLHRIKQSFLSGWDFLSELMLGLLTVWPLWLALAIGLAAWKKHQSRIAKKPA